MGLITGLVKSAFFGEREETMEQGEAPARLSDAEVFLYAIRRNEKLSLTQLRQIAQRGKYHVSELDKTIHFSYYDEWRDPREFEDMINKHLLFKHLIERSEIDGERYFKLTNLGRQKLKELDDYCHRLGVSNIATPGKISLSDYELIQLIVYENEPIERREIEKIARSGEYFIKGIRRTVRFSYDQEDWSRKTTTFEEDMNRGESGNFDVEYTGVKGERVYKLSPWGRGEAKLIRDACKSNDVLPQAIPTDDVQNRDLSR